jgi:hypothetical protein
MSTIKPLISARSSGLNHTLLRIDVPWSSSWYIISPIRRFLDFCVFCTMRNKIVKVKLGNVPSCSVA